MSSAAARTGSFIRSRRAACPPTPFTRKRSSSLEAMYFPRRKPNVPVLSMGSTCCPTNAAMRYPSNGRSRITSEAPPGFRLLARLEKSEHRSAEEVAVTVEDFQRPEQDGRMHVMAAGVHHPLMDRSEFEPGRLRNRKRIHIGPQHERIPLAADARLRPLDTGEDTRPRHTAVFDTLVLERLGHDLRCSVLLEREPPGAGAGSCATS